jgi:carboxyl-terminal processing protease
LAERVVSRLIEDLGLRGDAARAARRTLWFLWFEAYLAAQGHRYDGYTYAAELARTRARDRGKSFSIGVALEVDGSGIVITEVLDAALAAQGVQSGARLAALDDRPVGSLSGADWDAYLLRSAPFDYTLTCVSARPVRGRAIAVRHRSIVWGRLGRAVYAHVRRFSEETEIELRRILRRVTREGASGLILDLRRDPGGRASPGLVDMFLKSGQPILTSAPLRGGEPKSELASVEYYGLPLVLLVDGQTVSMAEVLAAAVRQHQRGLLVGQRTFGKGVGQRVTPVLDEGELALESRIYYYPGTTTTWNAIGIQPDVEVPPAGEALSEMLHAPMLDLERQLSVDEALQVARRRLEEEQ